MGGVFSRRTVVSRLPHAVLTTRALNRALLARQHLIERADLSPEAMIEHLVGLQAQAPNPPYYGLWTRLRDFQTADLSRLIERRRVVRISLMRSTIHLVTADDCLAIRPLLQDVHVKRFLNTYGRLLTGLNLDEVGAVGRRLVEERPRTFSELAELLGQRWPERDARALAQTVRALVPLVQVPPRGLWGQSGQAAHTSAESWLGLKLADTTDLPRLIRRYLAAFGPATVQDMQTWSGLTALRGVVKRMRPELLVFQDERGRELFDVPEAPRPDPEMPAPTRFLPEYDNALLSHHDRTRIISDEHRSVVFSVNGIIRGTVLRDGFVAGTWKTACQRGAATLTVELFGAVEDRSQLEDEGEQLLRFAFPEAESRDIRFEA